MLKGLKSSVLAVTSFFTRRVGPELLMPDAGVDSGVGSASSSFTITQLLPSSLLLLVSVDADSAGRELEACRELERERDAL